MANESKTPTEIASLNKELFSFDLKDLTLEELDSRLELAIMTMEFGLTECGQFTCEINCGRGDSCDSFTCGNNC